MMLLFKIHWLVYVGNQNQQEGFILDVVCGILKWSGDTFILLGRNFINSFNTGNLEHIAVETVAAAACATALKLSGVLFVCVCFNLLIYLINSIFIY